MDKSTVGKRILLQRKRVGLTQTQLANRIHVGKSTISAWENDRSEPSLSYFQDLSVALGCSKAYLLGVSKEERDKNSKQLYSQSVKYRKHTHEWNVIRNLMLAFSVVSAITTVVSWSWNWYIASLVSILVYIVSTVIMGVVDSKNSKSKIYYPLGEKLVFRHSSTEPEIRKIKKDHITTVMFQAFLILLSLITLVGTTYESMSSNQSVGIALLFVVVMGWTLFMLFEGFTRAYIGLEVQYDKVRKNFGLGIFELNLTLSLVWFITCLMFFFTYGNREVEVGVLLMTIGVPSLYLVLAWTIQYGQSKFYAGFTLYSYNMKQNAYTNLEEME